MTACCIVLPEITSESTAFGGETIQLELGSAWPAGIRVKTIEPSQNRGVEDQ